MCKELVEKTKYNGIVIRKPIPPVIAIHTGYGAISIFFVDFKLDITEYKF